MTAVPIDSRRPRQRLPEPEHRRTGAKVRRFSKPAGGEPRERLTRQQANRRLFALELYQVKTRKKGQRFGAAGTISDGAIRMYKILLNMAVKTGKVEPSARWLASACNRPVKVIHKWKAQLQAHGFLDWNRRWVETGRDGVRGPQVEQTSNLYWVKLPKAALELLEKIARKGKPAPEHEPSAEIAAALASLDAARESRLRNDRHRIE